MDREGTVRTEAARLRPDPDESGGLRRGGPSGRRFGMTTSPPICMIEYGTGGFRLQGGGAPLRGENSGTGEQENRRAGMGRSRSQAGGCRLEVRTEQLATSNYQLVVRSRKRGRRREMMGKRWVGWAVGAEE